MFTVLVGHAGVGKGSALLPAYALLKEANTVNRISDCQTIERVLEILSKGFPLVQQAGAGVTFGVDSSCIITAPELQVFVTASQRTLPILADLWDNKESFDYGTKTQGKFVIHNPSVSLLGGSTTEWLVDAIPESAIGGGFTRRVNFVYAKESARKIAFPVMNGNNKIYTDLVEDLRQISTLRGEIQLADANARALFKDYYDKCKSDEFDDEAVAAYTTTRWTHAIKLATALCVGEADNLRITEDHLSRAITAVDNIQSTLELVFRAVGESDLSTATDRVLRFIENKSYVSRSQILRANWRHISSSDLDMILTTLTQSVLVKETTVGHQIMYEPIPKGGLVP